MVYWLLFKRSFRSFPFFFIVNFVTVIATVLVLIFARSSSSLFASLYIITTPLLWGFILNPIKTVTCRKSTLMIPVFRRINADFYIFFGLFAFLFLLSTVSLLAGIMAGEPMRFFFISIGFGLFMYGLLLFLIHFLGTLIFLAFLSIPWQQSHHKQIVQIFTGLHKQQLAGLFFLLGLILIFLYRRAIVRLTEESVFSRHQTRSLSFYEARNVRAAAKQTKSFYSKRGFWTNGHRFTFEFFLNLFDRLNAPRRIKIFALSVLKNYMDIFSFTSGACGIVLVIIVITLTSKTPGWASYSGFYFWWMLIIILMPKISAINKGLKQDAEKPINRNRLFITDYTGTYLAATATTVEIWIGVKLGMLVVSATAPSVSLFSGIIGAFLIVSVLLVARRFIKNLLIPLAISMPIIMFFVFIFYYRRPIIFQNMARFSNPALYLAELAPTVLFSIIAFRLDLKRDLA